MPIPALFIRGGTSKGLFFDARDLPVAHEERDQLLLKIMGSPDPTGMQLNGMGGGISSTSKVAILKPSEREGMDVDYLFGQVHLTKASIDWSGSCGNLASAVALYAEYKKWSFAKPIIKVWQENLAYEIQATLGSSKEEDAIQIPGVFQKERAIQVDFIHPGSSKQVLIENKPLHTIDLDNGSTIEATLINAANPLVIVSASDIGFDFSIPFEKQNYAVLSPLIEELARKAVLKMGIPYTAAVRVAWVDKPTDYQTKCSQLVSKESVDLVGCISTEGRIHHAFTGTGAVNLASAANISGTIPNRLLKSTSQTIRLGQPSGCMEISAFVYQDKETKDWLINKAGFVRTAKILMEGQVFP